MLDDSFVELVVRGAIENQSNPQLDAWLNDAGVTANNVSDIAVTIGKAYLKVASETARPIDQVHTGMLIDIAEAGLSIINQGTDISAVIDTERVVASQRHSELVQEIRSARRATPELTPTSLRNQLPWNVSAILASLESSDSVSANYLADQLGADTSLHRRNATRLLTDAASASVGLPALAFDAIGALLLAHGANESASLAYAIAAERDSTRKARYRAYQALCEAALGNIDAASDLLVEAVDDPDIRWASFAQFTRAAVTDDGSALVSFEGIVENLDELDRPLGSLWVGRALLGSDELDRAVEYLLIACESWPRHAGMLCTAAGALLIRAGLEVATRRTADAAKALELSESAIVSRQSWGGDTSEAIEAACQAAYLLSDFDKVLELAGDDGTGTLAVAEADVVRSLVIRSRLSMGLDALEARSDYEREWLAGLACRGNPAVRGRALYHFRLALRAATQPWQVEQIHRHLAELGETTEERAEEISQDRRSAITGLAMVRRGRDSGRP